MTSVTVQINQKIIATKFQAQDSNGDAVASFNGLTPSVDQTGAITFANLTTLPAAAPGADPQFPAGYPANSTYSIDIVPTALTTGAATITATGQQGNGLPTFTTQMQVTVVANPNAPGLPIQWDIVVGTIVSQ